ncbi:DUF2868 domain-containing protein [Moraxella oblonga]|uniref:DUF2868 domain-containing protein n=1 Tax=Moraxella oblonga TaxID=200413 RepID=UPI0008308DB8|nr:DUF2868 domain-containing protein [Moraxella oblonga]
MKNHIHLENVSLDKIDNDTHKLLDLVRRLETSDFVFATDPKVATDLAKSSEGTPTDKLIYRATILDETNDLTYALYKGNFLVKSVSKIYAIISFVLGFIGVIGLLNTHIVNFFYVLLMLLGWHTITLILWLIGLKNQNPYSGIYGILDKIRPKIAIQAHAFDIYLEEFQKNAVWQLGKVIHKAWLFGLLGSVLALFVMFLFKSYVFVWESTLLSPKTFMMMLKTFGFVPSLFGFDATQIDPSTGDISHARLATLIMLSVVIYGMIPRLGVYILCHLKANEYFQIDQNLYYYENFIRTFNQKIVDKDDFNPASPATNKSVRLSKTKTVVATLERPHDGDWHGQTNTKNLGTVDNKDEILHLIKTANTLQAHIILGIDTQSLPDRGILRKLEVICQHTQNGASVKLLGHADYSDKWQQILADRQIEQA